MPLSCPTTDTCRPIVPLSVPTTDTCRVVTAAVGHDVGCMAGPLSEYTSGPPYPGDRIHRDTGVTVDSIMVAEKDTRSADPKTDPGRIRDGSGTEP